MPKGFFEEKQVEAPNSEQKWTRKEHALLLDTWFAGEATYLNLSRKFRRSSKSIQRQIHRLEYNEKEWAERYQPVHREDRTGLPLTQNEKHLLKTHRQNGVSLEVSLKVLCRKELPPTSPKHYTNKKKEMIARDDARMEAHLAVSKVSEVSSFVDLVAAHQFLYYVEHISLISDKAYDEMEKELREMGPSINIVLSRPGSDVREDYPPHIRALALYLALKYGKKG